ncbi:hypothetical protein M569_01038 [Genlisea aurea]|uniref:Uncharacterized protein n=1 Tax=Genlisea aurea TaxID=192259 RepID=S8ECP0_9LAMI|nr:hypothetical protein M569_01038 [Genlisea aurea]
MSLLLDSWLFRPKNDFRYNIFILSIMLVFSFAVMVRTDCDYIRLVCRWVDFAKLLIDPQDVPHIEKWQNRMIREEAFVGVVGLAVGTAVAVLRRFA